MIQETKQELYTSPEVEVIEVKARQVMCTSTTPFGDGGTIDQDWNY